MIIFCDRTEASIVYQYAKGHVIMVRQKPHDSMENKFLFYILLFVVDLNT